MSGKVFVSHSQADRGCATALVAQLESAGIDCWIAPRDISPAADWAAAIIEAISAARLMVLVFSASSNASPQVRREVERAVHKQRAILPFRIEDVLPSSSLEYFLSSQHWMDAFPGPLEPHFERLCCYLKSQPTDLEPTIPAASRVPQRPAVAVVTPAPVAVRAASPKLAGVDLMPIVRRLAEYIGPVARHLVQQAALRADTADDFIARLAADIEPRERAAFERKCREVLPHELQLSKIARSDDS
jgi:hypothetical protein